MLYANQNNIDLAKQILHEEMGMAGKAVDGGRIETMVAEVLDTAYSIGGSYNETTIRSIVKSMIARNIL